MRMIRKRGQIWVETVIYTLIGLAVIGLVLAAALPKINAKKDEAMIEQSIEALGNIDNKVYEVLNKGVGNRRIIESLKIGKGALLIDMEEDTVSWILDSSYEYSEEDLWVSKGKINVTTTRGKPWTVELELKYDLDIRYNNETSGTKQLDVAPTPYKLAIENTGKNADGNIVIDFSGI